MKVSIYLNLKLRPPRKCSEASFFLARAPHKLGAVPVLSPVPVWYYQLYQPAAAIHPRSRALAARRP